MENIWHMLPSSPMWHVHARKSGKMAFGGGGPSMAEIKSGVSDVVNPQFTTLGSGQAGIESSISGIVDDIAGLSRTVSDRSGELSGISSDISGLQSGMNTGFGNVTDQFNAQNQTLGTIENNQGVMQGAIDQGFADTQGAMADNFASTNENLLGINANIGNLGADMSGRFDTTDSSLSGLSDQLSSANEGILAGQGAQTDALGNQITASQNAITQGVTDAQAANLEGQQGLSKQLGTMSTNQDTYYGDLASRAEDAQGQADDFRSAFDTYKQQYDTDVGIANTTRGDLQRSVRGLGNQMFAQNEALNKNLDRSTAEVIRSGEDLAEANIEPAMASRGISPEQLMGGVQTMTELLQSPEVSNTAKMRFRDVMSAFDPNGNLISRSQGSDGALTFRSMDETGMLKIGKFDAAGNSMSNQSFDMPKMVSDLTNLRASLNGGGMMS